MWTDGWNDPTLRQQREQTDGFDQHRLTARVGTRNQNRELVGKQLQIKGYGMIQQRVTPCPDLEMRADFGHEAVSLDRIPRPRARLDRAIPRSRSACP